MNMKKVIALLLAMVMLVSLVAGCGKEEASETPEATEAPESTKTAEATPEGPAPVEPANITIFSDQNTATQSEELNVAFEEQSDHTIEYIVVPGQAGEIYEKIDISLMSGEKTDLINCNEKYFNKFGRAGFGYRLNDLIDADESYDAKEVHGPYLETFNDGDIFGLPNGTSKWAVFYNKKIFDDAGVEYPSGSWTWDEYIETAKKLTDADAGIYGSYMPTYDNVFHLKANQAGISAYKEDGTSNFSDDPVFAEGLQFYHELSAVHGIQQSFVEQKLKKLGSFHFLGGKNAMMLISSWYLDPITDYEKYPRDWEIGITQIPTFSDVENNCNFGSTGYIAVNKNSENPEAAYEYTKFVALNQYKYRNSFPAFVDVSKEDITPVLQRVEDGTKGEITVDELYATYFDNGLGFAGEKLGGLIASEYSDCLKQEAELYVNGDITLEEAVQNITDRANDAIAAAE